MRRVLSHLAPGLLVLGLFAPPMSACGGAECPTIDEAALRAQIREEVLEDLRHSNEVRRHELAEPEATAPNVRVPGTRLLVPTAHAPAQGATEPLVTIVTFSDFQCPFCGRVQATLRQLLERYPDEVRLVFRNNPLPFHRDAMPAAEAALEAYDQGGDEMFWRYHDLLFENQRSLDRASLEAYAAQVGMDVARLSQALDRGTHRARIERDQELTNARGARGTPAFFINGRQLMGAQPIDEFAAIVDEEIALARRLMEAGTPRGRLYARVLRDARTEPAPETERRPRPSARRRPDPDAVYRVPVAGRPQRGPDDALVTIVEYADFQCPFCARVQSTVRQIRQRYGNDVRVVYRHNPLPFHQDAMPAAEAAEEVFTQQGSDAFFRFAELLFENQRSLDEANLLAWAAQVGADPGEVAAALADHRHQATIQRDAQLTRDLGAGGTPSFFINGRSLVGAQPLPAFEAVIDEELTRARERVSQGTPRSQLYDRIIRDGHTSPQTIGGD